MSDFESNLKSFLIADGKVPEPSLRSYMQALEETLSKMDAKSITEKRRLEMAREQLKGVRRHSKRLEERLALKEAENKELFEKLTLLEENKDKVND